VYLPFRGWGGNQAPVVLDFLCVCVRGVREQEAGVEKMNVSKRVATNMYVIGVNLNGPGQRVILILRQAVCGMGHPTDCRILCLGAKKGLRA
jgi:hypothetical protein